MSSPCRARVLARTAVLVLTITAMISVATGCGDDEVADPPGTSGATLGLEEQLNQLDVLLRESIGEIGLDPDAGRREVVDNSCVGPGGSGKNVRFYFDESSHDRGVDYLRALEDYWSTADGYEMNDPLQDDGSLASLLATSGDFGLEGWWFPASEELTVGGSTTCVE